MIKNKNNKMNHKISNHKLALKEVVGVEGDVEEGEVVHEAEVEEGEEAEVKQKIQLLK